jgi:hypothetical protein
MTWYLARDVLGFSLEERWEQGGAIARRNRGALAAGRTIQHLHRTTGNSGRDHAKKGQGDSGVSSRPLTNCDAYAKTFRSRDWPVG